MPTSFWGESHLCSHHFIINAHYIAVNRLNGRVLPVDESDVIVVALYQTANRRNDRRTPGRVDVVVGRAALHVITKSMLQAVVIIVTEVVDIILLVVDQTLSFLVRTSAWNREFACIRMHIGIIVQTHAKRKLAFNALTRRNDSIFIDVVLTYGSRRRSRAVCTSHSLRRPSCFFLQLRIVYMW